MVTQTKSPANRASLSPLLQGQWNSSSEKQKLKRKHDEVKRFNALLMKVTTLVLDTQQPQVSTQNSHFPGVSLRAKSSTAGKEKQTKLKIRFPARANGQLSCFLQLFSACLKFFH